MLRGRRRPGVWDAPRVVFAPRAPEPPLGISRTFADFGGISRALRFAMALRDDLGSGLRMASNVLLTSPPHPEGKVLKPWIMIKAHLGCSQSWAASCCNLPLRPTESKLGKFARAPPLRLRDLSKQEDQGFKRFVSPDKNVCAPKCPAKHGNRVRQCHRCEVMQ